MSMNTSGRRSRSRRSERTQQLYEARSLPTDREYEETAQPERYEAASDAVVYPSGAYPFNAPEDDKVPETPRTYTDTDFPPNDGSNAWDGGTDDEARMEAPQTYADAAYPPNDSEDEQNGDGYGEWAEPPQAYDDMPAASGGEVSPYSRAAAYARTNADGSDPAASYRRPTVPGAPPAEDATGESQFAYAPPVKLGYTSLYAQDQPEGDESASLQNNIYHPRDASWAMTDRARAAQMPKGYQVEEDGEAPVTRRRRKRRIRRALILAGVLAVLGGAGYAFREPLTTTVSAWLGNPVEPTLPAAAITTPAPVKAYDAAAPMEITSKTSNAISRISGSLEMEPYVVTDTSILARNPRPNGTYDFYLFSADQGRLLAYYEGLGARDVFPLSDGGFYLRQPPYLIQPDGADMLQTNDIERMLGEPAVLEPLMNGWAVVRNESGTLFNYVNAEARLLSRLWFAKAWPMTGERTVAYVDTGNRDDLDGRYALYVASQAGEAVKWLDAGDMDGVVASACGAAYLNTGELYGLDDLDAPLLTADEVRFYVDCDAMVIRDAATGKYGLYVHGVQHYACDYERIEPVPSDLQWSSQRFSGAAGEATVSCVTEAAYPQPMSHYFSLSRDGVEEYVALSTSSACPVILD